MAKQHDDDLPEFSEEWAASGISEASLRRYTAPPPAPATPRRGSATGAPPGPRDWSPAGADSIGVGQTPGHRPRRVWIWVVAALAVAGIFTWSSLRTPDGSNNSPIGIASASPIAPSGSDTEPAVIGLTPAIKVGTCFDVPDTLQTSTVRFASCAAKHTYEFVALESATGSDTQYPPNSYWDGPVSSRCTTDLVSYSGQPVAHWGPHLVASKFVPRHDGWATGDRTIYCVAMWQPDQAGSARHIKAYLAPHAPITGTAAH